MSAISQNLLNDSQKEPNGLALWVGGACAELGHVYSCRLREHARRCTAYTEHAVLKVYASSPNESSVFEAFFGFFFVSFFPLLPSLPVSSPGSPIAFLFFKLVVASLNPDLEDENERLEVCVFVLDDGASTGALGVDASFASSFAGSGREASPFSDIH